MTLLNFTPLKTLSPSTIMLGVKASTCEFGEDKIQSMTPPSEPIY